MTRLGYRPALDGIRGVAILGVVAYHYFGLKGGFAGVDVFFVLSGFLITTLLLEERDRTGQLKLRSFYGRRALRLLPAVGGVLVFVAIFGPAAFGATRTIEMIGASLFYMVNIINASAHAEILVKTPVRHLWSLAAEEQFYLVWPIVLLTVLRRRWWDRRLAKFLALTFLVLVAYRIGMIATGASLDRVMFAPDTHADGLVIGCLAAVLRRRGSRPCAAVVFLAALVLAAAFIMVTPSYAWAAVGLPVVEIAAAIVVLAAAEPRGLSRMLSVRPLVWVGALSYSLYLWHEVARWATGWTHPWWAFTMAVPLTLVSYYAIERPFRLRRRRASSEGLAPAATRAAQPSSA